MKIIATDNFGRDIIADQLICENVDEYYGKKILELLNEKDGGDYADSYFQLVENDYKLYKGFQP